ncbi:hypothetical protein [Caldimonas sp. KR1-144]|uniref:hypothetical protein n=1 Tax=Caldimonas sp. KR1-144 TaxID=3400911 RepID=UPI003C04FC3C
MQSPTPSIALAASTVLAKTVRARNALRDGSFPGTRSQRLFLIIVDGRKPLRELAAPLRSLGLDEPGLRRMLAEGWLAPVAAAPSAPAAPSEPARAGLPLGAVKLYALDLVALMLPGRDGALREASREVQDEAELRAWIERAAEAVAEHAGADRAAVFRERVGRQLPEPAALDVSL